MIKTATVRNNEDEEIGKLLVEVEYIKAPWKEIPEKIPSP